MPKTQGLQDGAVSGQVSRNHLALDTEGAHAVIGGNFAYLADATFDVTAAPVSEFNLSAWGVDMFFNSGRWVFEGEYDRFKENVTGAGPNIHVNGWFVQGGYLLNYWQYLNCECNHAIELAARYQGSDTLTPVGGIADRLKWTSIGFNVYIRDHNLKIQREYIFKSEEVASTNNDAFQMQLQLDY